MLSARPIQALCLALICLAFYVVTNYGGIRSPDEEVVFKVSQSLLAGRGFAVAEDLDLAPGFGTATGVDGRRYAVYPPGNSVWLMPLTWLAGRINETRWYEGHTLPFSFYVDQGFPRHVLGNEAGAPRVHALRFVVTTLNLLTSLLAVLLFWALVLRITRSPAAAFVTAILFALGSLAWSYSATLFSEPVATLFCLLSLFLLVPHDPTVSDTRRRLRGPVLIASGLCVGFATSVHVTSILFAPFVAGYAVHLGRSRGRRVAAGAVYPLLTWTTGLLLVLGLLGIFNHARFGDVFESGRSLNEFNRVVFQPPWTAPFWRGLYGVLVGWGRGLLPFCPAVILAALGWPALLRRHRALAVAVIGAVVLRILVIASYKDWHGGFCLGPRYLFPILPLLLLPFGSWLADRLDRRQPRAVFVAVLAVGVCAVQQFYFALGEIFTFSHMVRAYFMQRGENIYLGDRIFLDWDLSPLHQLHLYPRGAFLLKQVPGTNLQVWLGGAVLLLMLAVGGAVWLKRRTR